MDAERFDAIAKALTSESTRRRTLGGLAGGALVALGLADPEDAWSQKSGTCPSTCGLCERCDEGRCRRNRRGKKRCRAGKCKVNTGGLCYDPVTDVSGTCQSDARCCLTPGTRCSRHCASNSRLFCNACCSGNCLNDGFCL